LIVDMDTGKIELIDFSSGAFGKGELFHEFDGRLFNVFSLRHIDYFQELLSSRGITTLNSDSIDLKTTKEIYEPSYMRDLSQWGKQIYQGYQGILG
jgi:hypothetical protein